MKFRLATLAPLLGAILLSVTAPKAEAIEIKPMTKVVELFTSQGCSSCPPADALLKEMRDEKGLLALAWHVDYWDYIGWKDVFGSEEFSKRQWQYAKTLGETRVYTPQAVINGRHHAVGSQEGKVRNLLKKDAGKLSPMKITASGDMIKVSLDQSKAKNIALVAVWYDEFGKTEIKRGENRGRTIVYSDIVKKSEQLAKSNNGKINVDIPLSQLKKVKAENCALLVQKIDASGNPGPIISASVVEKL